VCPLYGYQLGIAKDASKLTPESTMSIYCDSIHRTAQKGLVVFPPAVRAGLPLSLGPTRSLMYIVWESQAPAQAELEPYSHFYANGSQQTGIYLGWQGYTTFAFSYENNTNGIEQYRTRLLVPGSTVEKLQEGEFAGFVRVADSFPSTA